MQFIQNVFPGNVILLIAGISCVAKIMNSLSSCNCIEQTNQTFETSVASRNFAPYHDMIDDNEGLFFKIDLDCVIP